MKILFICENYYPHIGGAEVVFKNLAERYVQQGHKVTILTHLLKGTKKRETINGVEIYRVPSVHSRYVFTFSSLQLAVKLARKQDIIQTTSFNGAPPAWLAAKITGKKVVITVHEVWIGKWQEVTEFSWIKSKIHELLERAIYVLPFDRYICVSHATKKDLLKLKIDEKQIDVVHNGLDYEFWNEHSVSEKEAQEVRKKLQIGREFVYFSWGRPGHSKGFEHLIKAVPIISQQLPHSTLLLMLNPQEKYREKYEELLSLIKENNGQDQIKLIPPVAYSELKKYIKAVNCVVIPSVAEGFGYTAVEATSMGIPVVVSNTGSLPEVVSERFQIFENKNSTDLAENVVKVAKKQWQETQRKIFPWEESVKQYLQIYNKLQSK